MATTSAAALAAENTMLGAIIDDLQRARPEADCAAVGHIQQQLRQTEDALLDMHEESRQMRASFHEQSEALQAVRRSLGEERRATLLLQQRVHRLSSERAAAERVLTEELAQLERLWLAETNEGYATRLREAADDAVRCMHEAQSECRWLYSQLQAVLMEAPAGGAALRVQLASPPQAIATPAAPGSASSQHSGGSRGGASVTSADLANADPSADAMRSAYVRAVQRCHELQLHAARAAEADATLRPELLRAFGRIAQLQAEVDSLRRADGSAHATISPPTLDLLAADAAAAEGVPSLHHQQATSGKSPSAPAVASSVSAQEQPQKSPLQPMQQQQQQQQLLRGGVTRSPAGAMGAAGSKPRIGTPGSGGGASAAAARETAGLRAELSRARAQVVSLERALEKRETEHKGDLDALCAAQRDAADSHRTLQSERAWVRALDQMRLDDMATIQLLEQRLEQWQGRFGGVEPLELELRGHA
jgi:hypothetical protein